MTIGRRTIEKENVANIGSDALRVEDVLIGRLITTHSDDDIFCAHRSNEGGEGLRKRVRNWQGLREENTYEEDGNAHFYRSRRPRWREEGRRERGG